MENIQSTNFSKVITIVAATIVLVVALFLCAAVYLHGTPTVLSAKKLLQPTAYQTSNSQYKTQHLVIRGQSMNVAVADTEQLRTQGLSGRQSIAPFDGMLFVFDSSGTYSFWMKDMSFPIDIVWIDDQYRVVDFIKNLSPNTFPAAFSPQGNSRYVLEMPTGTVSKINLQKGDLISFGQ